MLKATHQKPPKQNLKITTKISNIPHQVRNNIQKESGSKLFSNGRNKSCNMKYAR
jgi:hypothetical protein